MTIIEKARLIREAMDAAGSALTEEQAVECAWMFEPYRVGVEYKKGKMLIYGVNGVGDPQIYRVEQLHTSETGWRPNETRALYTPIGLTADGYPIWARPTGAQDAYGYGNIVEYKGFLYKSIHPANVWAPDEYPDAWERVIK